MNRRHFLKNTTTLLSAIPFSSFASMAVPELKMENEVHRFKIGEIDCTLFRDLLFTYKAKDFFINADEQILKTSLAKYQQNSGDIPSPFVALLLQISNKKILIDTGVGFTEKPVVVNGKPQVFNGRLQYLLEKEGVKKEAITDVIVTHFHPDHIGGIYNEDGKLNFPNAQFHLHANEWDYWHTSKSVNQPEQFKYFIEINITGLKAHDLNLLTGESGRISDGITTIRAEGHTPGQIAVAIESEGQQLLYISDAFLHPLHMENLNWQTSYDLEHSKAKHSRIKLLELANKENMLINAFHFGFPGLGQVDKINNLWKWQPLIA